MFNDAMCERLLELAADPNDSSSFSCSQITEGTSQARTWKEILSIFNSEFPSSRKTITQLQVKLRNLRQQQEAAKNKVKRKADGKPVTRRSSALAQHNVYGDQSLLAETSAISGGPSTSTSMRESTAQFVSDIPYEPIDADSVYTPQQSQIFNQTYNEDPLSRKIQKLNTRLPSQQTNATYFHETLIDLKATVLQRQLEVHNQTLQLIAKANIALDLFMRKMSS